MDFSSIGGRPADGAAGSTSSIDFSSIGGTHVDQDQGPAAIPESEKGIGPALGRAWTGLIHLPGNLYHAFADEPKDLDEAMGALMLSKTYHLPEGMALGIHRLIIAPAVREHDIAGAYDKIHSSLPAEQQEREKDFSNMDSNLHKANMHRIASVVPLLGPLAANITEHYLQGDTSGAVTDLLTNLAAGKGLESVTKGVAKNIARIAPRTVRVAGQEVPVMAGQIKDAAPIAEKVAAEPGPAMAEAQQSATQAGVKQIATDALNRQLERVGGEAAPSRLALPAPEGGGEPFTFKIAGDVPQEVITGKGVVPAARRLVEDMTPEVGASRPGFVAGTEGPAVPGKWQFLTSGTEAGESVTTKGPGTLHTSDVNVAQDTLNGLKSIENPTPAVQQAISSLEDQLKQYHAYDNVPTESPAIPRAGQASSFRDAAEQVKGAAQPTFKKLDQLSEGEFATLQNKIKMARAASRRATNVADMEAAETQLAQAQKGVNDLIDKHGSAFQPNELRNAQLAWKDMQVLDDIHGYVEKAFSAPESVASTSKLVTRTLDGNKLISNLNSMVDKIPAEDLTRVLGPDGLNNLYELGHITAKPGQAAAMNNIIAEVSKKLTRGGVGGAVGAMFGGPKGAAVGAALGAGKDAILRAIATRPRVADLTLKALKFGTPAKLYAPLIANEISKAQDDEQ